MLCLVCGIVKFGNSNVDVIDIVSRAIDRFDRWANDKGNSYKNALGYVLNNLIVILLDKHAAVPNNVVEPSSPKRNVYIPPHRR